MSHSVAENTELVNCMKNIDLFKIMDKNALWALANLASWRRFAAGDLLICEASPPVGIFILKTGKVQVYKTKPDGSKLFITELLPGHIVGEISVMDRLKTCASVVALEAVECIFISAQDFINQIHSFPQIGLQLMTERLAMMQNKLYRS